MANKIAYASKMTEELDKLFVQSAVTGFLTDNTLRAKFVGAHTVLIPEMELSGLGDYDRQSGFAEGAINVSNTAFELTQDRGRSFMLDAQDEDESGVANLAGQVLGEFVRTKVVPEVDAYCLSKLALATLQENRTEALLEGETVETHALSLLRRLIARVRDKVGYDEPLVAFVDQKVFEGLMATPEVTRFVRADDFKKGELTQRISTVDGVAILPVPKSRMKTQFEFLTDEVGGFAPADGAMSIGALVMPKKGASLIRKTEKLRTFTPEQNQRADAYKFDYRLYYDLIVKNSMKDATYSYLY